MEDSNIESLKESISNRFEDLSKLSHEIEVLKFNAIATGKVNLQFKTLLEQVPDKVDQIGKNLETALYIYSIRK